MNNTTVEVLTSSFSGLWVRFINFLPVVVTAIVVLVVGWIVAVIVGKLVTKIIKTVKIDEIVEKAKIGGKFKEAGIELSVSGFIGGVVKWFLILVFLMAATDILGLSQVTDFLNQVIFYIPNIVVATVILAISFLVGNLVYNIVRHSTRAAGVFSAALLAVVSKWAIVIFGVLAALIQLGIAPTMLNTIFIGIIAALSLAIGLAFGLGGKEEAAAILRKLREEISNK